MKKVLVIITTSLVSYGGLATVALNYYRNIDGKSIHMDFASTNDLQNDLQQEFDEKDSHYYKLPQRKKIISYISELRKISKNYDCVHIHTNSATASLELFAAKKVEKKIVHIHNTTCTHKILHSIFLPYLKKNMTDAVACSKAAGDWIFGENSFTVLNNAIDLKKYNYSEEDRTSIREQLKLYDKPVIGNVGKLVEQKNHSFALDVFSKVLLEIPDAKFVLVGGGYLQGGLEEKAKNLGIEKNVIFCGMVDNAKEYYSAFDCILFPSLWEGLPLSLIEAQASGLTCVASDTITPEVNMGGVIQLSLTECTNRWAECIRSSLNSNRRNCLTKYRENIKRRGFDIKNSARILEKIYLE